MSFHIRSVWHALGAVLQTLSYEHVLTFVFLFLLSSSERDTTEQRIGPVDEVITVVTELVDGSLDWEGACSRLPAYGGQQDV